MHTIGRSEQCKLNDVEDTLAAVTDALAQAALRFIINSGKPCLISDFTTSVSDDAGGLKTVTVEAVIKPFDEAIAELGGEYVEQIPYRFEVETDSVAKFCNWAWERLRY